MKFLYAAYAATWIIHIVYLAVLASGFTRLKRDYDELNKAG